MYQWNAKVHKSGSKVAIFDGTKLLKIIESSKDTFEPAEAQKFAEELVTELNTRSATHSGAPMVDTKEEQHAADLAAVGQQATGKSVSQMPIEEVMAPTEENPEEDAAACDKPEEGQEDAAAQEEETKESNKELRNVVATLQKKLAKEREERLTERKARRGLAIAKQMVAEGKLEDSYDSIKNKVAEIVKLEFSEIDRLERKVAGEQEFETVDDAQREIRRLNRISRINRQAAAEAQEDMDESQADMLDKRADEAEIKASHIQQVVAAMTKKAEEEGDEKPAEEKKEEKKPAEDAAPAAEEKKEEAGEEKGEKEAAKKDKKKDKEPDADKDDKKVKKEAKEVPPAEAAPDGTDAAPAAKPAEEKKEEEDAVEIEKQEEASLARSYRRIASSHRKLAEAAEAKGDVKTADLEDSAADTAEEKAEAIEKKLSALKVTAEKPEGIGAEPTDPAKSVKQEEEDAAACEEKPKEEAAEEKPAEGAQEEDAANPMVADPKGDKGGVQPVAKVAPTPLKREGAVVESNEFGIDKNASLVETNEYTNDPEVEILSTMWKGAPKDDQ